MLFPTFVPLTASPQPGTLCPASSWALGSMILVQLKSLEDSAWASPELGSVFFSLVPLLSLLLLSLQQGSHYLHVIAVLEARLAQLSN